MRSGFLSRRHNALFIKTQFDQLLSAYYIFHYKQKAHKSVSYDFLFEIKTIGIEWRYLCSELSAVQIDCFASYYLRCDHSEELMNSQKFVICKQKWIRIDNNLKCFCFENDDSFIFGELISLEFQCYSSSKKKKLFNLHYTHSRINTKHKFITLESFKFHQFSLPFGVVFFPSLFFWVDLLSWTIF